LSAGTRHACAALLGALAAAGSCAGPLAVQPEGAVSLEARAGHALTGAVGDPQAPAPTWHVAQWNIPVELPPGRAPAPGRGWRLANDYAQLAWNRETGTYELGTDGRLDRPDCRDEFDLFLEPNGPTLPQAPGGVQPSQPLAQLRAVRLHFGYRLAAQATTARCRTNYASSIVAVVLDAPRRRQTLYYQVVLVDSRGGDRGPALRRAWCPGNSEHDFCVDTSVTRFGMPAPAPGGPRTVYDFDLRDELADLIRAGHGALDTELADWHVASVYLGNIVLGGAATTTQWDGFSLSTEP